MCVRLEHPWSREVFMIANTILNKKNEVKIDNYLWENGRSYL